MSRAEAWALSRPDPDSYCRWSDEGCGRAGVRFDGWNYCLLHGEQEYVAALWGDLKGAESLKALKRVAS